MNINNKTIALLLLTLFSVEASSTRREKVAEARRQGTAQTVSQQQVQPLIVPTFPQDDLQSKWHQPKTLQQEHYDRLYEEFRLQQAAEVEWQRQQQEAAIKPVEELARQAKDIRRRQRDERAEVNRQAGAAGSWEKEKAIRMAGYEAEEHQLEQDAPLLEELQRRLQDVAPEFAKQIAARLPPEKRNHWPAATLLAELEYAPQNLSQHQAAARNELQQKQQNAARAARDRLWRQAKEFIELRNKLDRTVDPARYHRQAADADFLAELQRQLKESAALYGEAKRTIRTFSKQVNLLEEEIYRLFEQDHLKQVEGLRKQHAALVAKLENEQDAEMESLQQMLLKAAEKEKQQQQEVEGRRLLDAVLSGTLDVPGVSLDDSGKSPVVGDYSKKMELLRVNCPLSGLFELKVARSRLVEGALSIFSRASPKNLGAQMSASFIHEICDSATVEFFNLFAAAMIDESMGLFGKTPSGKLFLKASSSAKSDRAKREEYGKRFKVLGRLLGVLLKQGRTMPGDFHPAFFKAILGETINLGDVWLWDEKQYGVFKSMLTCSPNELELKAIPFVFLDNELILNGKQTMVTAKTVQSFVKLAIEAIFLKRFKRQFELIRRGFFDVISLDCIKGFSAADLAKTLHGMDQIDVDDWKDNTEVDATCRKGKGKKVLKWFWKYVRSLPDDKRREVLKFATGFDQVSGAGFKYLTDAYGYPKCFKLSCGPGVLATAITDKNSLRLPTDANDETHFKEQMAKSMVKNTGQGKK